MAQNRPTICLNMIVKNEAHVIRRCLDSVRPLIDTWVIVDTGSTDGTQDLIREIFADLPGELHERPWHDFGYNRSESRRSFRDCFGGGSYVRDGIWGNLRLSYVITCIRFVLPRRYDHGYLDFI